MTLPPGEVIPNAAIQMEDVSIGSLHDFNATVAAHVHWTVTAGDYWVIAGLQGAGKTDFLMTVGGLMAPLEGRYELFGETMPIFDEPRLPQRLRLGLVFDGGRLFNQLTVRENVALPLRYHRNLKRNQAEVEVNALLEAAELLPWADSTPGTMSRNWQKRVGLARALMLQPEVLLLDDPLASLDPRHSSWWLSFLGRLSRGQNPAPDRPITLVVTSADLRPWEGQARQFAVLKDRRLTALGSWDQVKSASEDLVREMLASPSPGG